jgi:hypothetical protein
LQQPRTQAAGDGHGSDGKTLRPVPQLPTATVMYLNTDVSKAGRGEAMHVNFSASIGR